MPAPAQASRPVTRGDCAGGVRPCPWIDCRYHLYPDLAVPGKRGGFVTVSRILESGITKYEIPRWQDMRETCALDVADRGGVTLNEIADIVGLTRERVRQLQARALALVHYHAPKLAREIDR